MSNSENSEDVEEDVVDEAGRDVGVGAVRVEQRSQRKEDNNGEHGEHTAEGTRSGTVAKRAQTKMYMKPTAARSDQMSAAQHRTCWTNM